MADDAFMALVRDVARRTGGQAKEPKPELRFDDSVDVTGDYRDNLFTQEMYKQPEMRKAYLGSADEPPLGVVFEPRSMRSVPDPKYPAMMRAFERLRTKYPYAARNVDRTVGDDKMLGTTQFAEVNVHVPRTIRFNPMLEQLSEQEQDETLEHELTHVGQNANTYGRKPKSVNDLYFNFEAPAYKTASDTDRAATMTEADRDRYLKAVAAEQLRRSRK